VRGATVSTAVSVRRTGDDSIAESTLETNGRIDFGHQREKTSGRRGQLGPAVWTGGKMVEHSRHFSSAEYSRGQLSEVRFESVELGLRRPTYRWDVAANWHE